MKKYTFWGENVNKKAKGKSNDIPDYIEICMSRYLLIRKADPDITKTAKVRNWNNGHRKQRSTRFSKKQNTRGYEHKTIGRWMVERIETNVEND